MLNTLMLVDIMGSLLYDDDDDDDELLLIRGTRRRKCTRDRLDWVSHEDQLVSENMFRRMYRMSPVSFHKLVGILSPRLKRNVQMSTLSTGKAYINEHLVVHCMIRYLAGGSPHDIRVMTGISRPHFYKVLWLGLDAILDSEDLYFTCPDLRPTNHITEADRDRKEATDRQRLMELSHSFSRLSTCNPKVFEGCVGAVDGWLATIRVPASKDEDFVTSCSGQGYLQFFLISTALSD
jgi:hypothetical protein